ncbi:MAG: hypothetical protein US52_C0038G0004 [candidate division WS6 bacterium GW2011_GWA2_37_6]|uniref:Uncharacterized protein n=1 Tax=candidate division WS6 bacterium GW2011_GWA2_37_6 TaxID=1619087 RepID=A0A0G0JE37_9BACT|nr:MAG: hypothetical protein US52_C0038G0004 [candidate division WS6 bacterium GW2011_GWA2_37_6]
MLECTMAEITIITDKIKLADLHENAKNMFGGLVKAVVDIEQGKMAVFGELHSDEESVLLENGSKQANLWGINIYPDQPDDKMIEFDSMINLRPSQGNMSRSVDDLKTQKKIIATVKKLIQK